jgi:type II secretion system protein E
MARHLGQILKELGYVNEPDLQKALEAQRAGGFKKRIGEILLEGVLDEDALLHGLSVQFNIPVLSEDQVPETLPIDKISFDFLKKNLILPLSLADNTLSVAVSDPTMTEALESIRASFDYEILPYLTKDSVIMGRIEELRASKDAVMQRLIEGVTAEQGETTEEAMGEISHLKDLAQEKGIIQLVNLVIENAIRENASDIHVEPEETAVRVRYRIDGILYDREILPPRTQAALSSRIKLLSQMNIAERRLPQDGRIKGTFAGKAVDIRVSTMPTVYGESIVMRILDREMSLISLEDIGFDGELLSKYSTLIKRPYGMILLTGPTGSGKTTTLYASLDKINHPDRKMITIEEPVEYLLRGINQIQVMPKIGLTFANGLRSIVRQDPDIIMVGEIRDLETAGIAVHASLTGHLLFSTLHTNDAPSAVTRLIDMGVENYLVSSTLIGVMAQRLVRRICTECRESYPAPDDIKIEIGDKFQNLWRGRGCENCMNTGYRGRIAIFELMIIDGDIRDLIIKKSTEREIRERAIATGMRTLREDGLIKVERGTTTLEEVFRVTQAEIRQ